MSDLFLNSNFEVEIDDRGDLKEVDGEERVKQSVVVHVTDAEYPLVGDAANQEEKLSQAVYRAMRTHPLVEDVESVEINRKQGSSAFEVFVSYDMNSFSFEVET